MEILIILFLVIINGILAMAEIAVVSSRKSKLQQQANEGSKNAEAALELANQPSRFLSTIQIGITFVGIFAGAFGGGTIAKSIANSLDNIPFLAPYSDSIALFIVVFGITVLSIVIGELVPKRIALNSPESIAKALAQPMNLFAQLVSPLASALTSLTDGILKLLAIEKDHEPTVSEEEVRMLIREGTRSGVFDIAEKDIVERTLRLGDKKVNSIMTPKQEIISLDMEGTFKVLREVLSKNPHGNYPVFTGSSENMVGIIRTEDLLTDYLMDRAFDLKKSMHEPVFIPESMDVLKVLETFKQSGLHVALVVDEYGTVLGLVSLTDILEEIVGDIPSIDEVKDQEIVKREDGSFLVDGLTTLDEFKDYFHIKKFPGEKTGGFNTIGGFVMDRLGKIPSPGDYFEWEPYKFEVLDMDKNRIDKVLVSLK